MIIIGPFLDVAKLVRAESAATIPPRLRRVKTSTMMAQLMPQQGDSDVLLTSALRQKCRHEASTYRAHYIAADFRRH